MMKSRFALGAALVLAAPVAIATAEIDLAWTGLGPNEWTKWSFDGSVTWDSATRAPMDPGYLGLYLFNGGEYEGYCYDLDAPVSNSPVPYEVQTWTDLDAETQDRARFLASLYDQWYDAVEDPGDDAMGAALAFLTNEIMEENYDFIPGTWYLADVQAQSSTSEGAVQFSEYTMEAGPTTTPCSPALDFGTDAMLDNLVFYNSTGSMQDFVGMVPAPSVLALLGIAGSGPPPSPKLIGSIATLHERVLAADTWNDPHLTRRVVLFFASRSAGDPEHLSATLDGVAAPVRACRTTARSTAWEDSNPEPEQFRCMTTRPETSR